MIKQILFLLSILFSIASNSYANENSIDKFFEVMEMDKQLSGGFEAMLPMIDQMTAQFKLDANAKEELINIYRAWFDEDIDRKLMMNEMKALYSDAFTTQEIEETVEFYQTPTGQKFLKLSPDLMKRGGQIGMKEAQSKQGQLLNRLKPFLEKHGIK